METKVTAKSIEFLRVLADIAEESAYTERRARAKENPGVKKIRDEMDRAIKELIQRSENISG